jgi:hypothetical protein
MEANFKFFLNGLGLAGIAAYLGTPHVLCTVDHLGVEPFVDAGLVVPPARQMLHLCWVSVMAAMVMRLSGPNSFLITLCMVPLTQQVVGGALHHIEPTPYAQGRWTALGLRHACGLPPGGPLTTASELSKVGLLLCDEFARKFGKGRGLIKFVKKEASHVQAGLTCFGNWLAHYHIVIVVHGMPDAQAFRNDVDAWMHDCGFVGKQTGAAFHAHPFLKINATTLGYVQSQLKYLVKAKETVAEKTFQRDFMWSTNTPCNCVMFADARVGPHSDALALPAFGGQVVQHALAHHAQWLAMPLAAVTTAHGLRAHYYAQLSLHAAVWLSYLAGVWGGRWDADTHLETDQL